MSFSSGLKINVNKLNADEQLLVLLEISHPFLTTPIRIVNDDKDFLFLSNNYLPMGFDISRQSDVKGELPKITLTVPNVGRGMVRWIDGSGGGKDAKMTVYLVRRSTPATIEEKLELGIESTNISIKTITFNLVIQNNLIKRSMRYIYDNKRAKGLF